LRTHVRAKLRKEITRLSYIRSHEYIAVLVTFPATLLAPRRCISGQGDGAPALEQELPKPLLGFKLKQLYWWRECNDNTNVRSFDLN
jgi:hypothetical protein